MNGTRTRAARIAVWLTITICCISCGDRTAALDRFTVPLYQPRYAGGFEIAGTAEGASTLVKIRNPWQGAERIEQQLLLLREGEQAPGGFKGQVARAPVRRVVCMSSSHVAMFDALSQTRRVVGVSGMEYISSPYVNEHRFCGEIRDVGYDTNINYELLVSLHPDLVMLYGVSGGNTSVTGKLEELGIPYIYIGDYVENHPLGKAEWLVLAAELIDQRDFGCERFTGIAERYEHLRESVERTSHRPSVMVNTPYRDTWFMPSEESYMVRLIEDAGGRYAATEICAGAGSSSVPISMEEAYLLADKADYWINVGQLNTLDALKAQNPRFSRIPAVEAGRVYNNNRRQTHAQGSDFWESGVVNPDIVLHDLIAIFHPEAAGSEPLFYYKRLE